MNMIRAELCRKLSILGMSLFMAIYFQVAWQYPVVDSFPLVERLIDPNFLLNDFYTNTMTEYSPRQNMVEFMVSVSQFFNVHPITFAAWANIIRIFCYALALYYFYGCFFRKKTTVFIAFYLSALSFLFVPNLPAWWPISYDFTASNLAGMFSLLAWCFALKNRVPICFAFLTLAVYFHPLVGVHSVLISIVLFYARYGLVEFVSLLKNPLVYISGALYFSVFLWVYLPYEKAVTEDEFIQINAVFKHAHHFFISYIEWEKWLAMAIYFSGLLYIFYQCKSSNNDDDFKRYSHIALAIVIYSICLMVVNVVFVDIYPMRSTISFIPLRAFPVLVSICMLCFAVYMTGLFDKGKFALFFLFHLAFLPYESVGLTWFVFPESHKIVLPMVVFSMLMILVVADGVLGNAFLKIDRIMSSFLRPFSLYEIIFPFVILALLFAAYRFEINIPRYDNQPALYSWIRDNTTENDIIVAELNAANNQKIRLLTKRAVVVSKDFPFSEKFYKEWYMRYQDVYEYQPVSRGRVDKRSSSELYDIMKKYGATVLIRTKELEGNHQFDEVGRALGENSEAIIYRLKSGLNHD